MGKADIQSEGGMSASDQSGHRPLPLPKYSPEPIGYGQSIWGRA